MRRRKKFELKRIKVSNIFGCLCSLEKPKKKKHNENLDLSMNAIAAKHTR